MASASQRFDQLNVDLRNLQRNRDEQGGQNGNSGENNQGGGGRQSGSERGERGENAKKEAGGKYSQRLKKEMKDKGKECLPIPDKDVCDIEELKTDFRCNREKTEICLKKNVNIWAIVILITTGLGCCVIGALLALCLKDKFKKSKKNPSENQVEATAIQSAGG